MKTYDESKGNVKPEDFVKRHVVTKSRISIHSNVPSKSYFLPVEYLYPEITSEKEKTKKLDEIEEDGYIAFDEYKDGKIDVRRVVMNGRQLNPDEVTPNIIQKLFPTKKQPTDDLVTKLLDGYYFSFHRRRN